MRFLCLAFVAASALCLSAPPCAGEEISSDLFRKALEHYRKAEYRQALEIVAVIETQDPERILFGEENLHNFKGSCLTALRYFQHARREFEKALQAQPESFDMQYNLAEMDFLQEHFTAASEKFAALKNTERGRPYSEFLDYKIAMCRLMEHDDESVLEEAEDRSAHAPLALFLRAAMALRNDQPDQAEVFLVMAKQKIDAEVYALYEDTLIESGLLAPPKLPGAEQDGGGDTAVRRPLSLGTDRFEPKHRPETADDPIEEFEAAPDPS